MLLVAMKCFRCGWFSIPNSTIEMEPEYCDSTIGAGISAADSRGSHYRGALMDVLLFRRWWDSTCLWSSNQEAKGGRFITFSFHQ